ncbi:DUF6122 family protein [Planobacterium oryzisoli]|uniref:Uncharacterized protein n=1 Tax=Planobacterium oryzisoli TaxID=2771435 RepID=A0A930YV43_9FLAO|nr:DUF6122 family protein [Planobacterium oryzisoli]MBF5026929.1 hypothetical protein [Planobacterium oryzisoli]
MEALGTALPAVELQTGVHYFLHLVFPALIAFFLAPRNCKKTYALLLLTMLVDLDHIFADPLFDPNRNSIGFHPLHTYPMIALYLLGSLFLKGNFRVVAIGLLWHMVTDFQDYYLWN